MSNFRNTLLISSKELKNDNSLISNNVDDGYLSSTIVTCQEVYLEQITGTALYHRLQELVYNQIIDSSTGDKINDEKMSEYKELIEGYIKPFLKSRTTVDILYNVAYKIRNAGVMKNSDTNIQPVDIQDIKYLEQQYLTYVDEYSQRLSKYLCAKKECFEELEADVPSYFDKPTLDKEYANTGGLWLGSRKKTNCIC